MKHRPTLWQFIWMTVVSLALIAAGALLLEAMINELLP